MTTQTRRSTRNKAERAGKAALPRPPSPSPARSRKTKREQLMGMLKAPGGTDLARISRKLGWQPHTTRAALTGLRKAGFTIERSKGGENGSLVYRITAKPMTKLPPERGE